MKFLDKQVVRLTLALAIVLLPFSVLALDCSVGTEQVLKIEYEVEDHLTCLDPKLIGLPGSSPRGINQRVLYQTKTKRKTVSKGKCLKQAGIKNKRTVYKNHDHHIVKIANRNKSYFINMTEKHGSVRYGVNDDVFEVKAKAYTADEFSKYKKMEVLPGYICGISPPLLNDPFKTKICSTDINGLRVMLYTEHMSIVSDHMNTYKASSIEMVCEDPSLFEPPEGVTLVEDY